MVCTWNTKVFVYSVPGTAGERTWNASVLSSVKIFTGIIVYVSMSSQSLPSGMPEGHPWNARASVGGVGDSLLERQGAPGTPGYHRQDHCTFKLI